MLLTGTSQLLKAAEEHGKPQIGLPDEVNEWRERNYPNLMRGLEKVQICDHYGVPGMFGSLYVSRVDRDGFRRDFGLASLRVVTTVGVNYLVDSFQASTTISNMRYHEWGTGTNAEAVGDTALQLPIPEARATGTRIEGATANVYRTEGTSPAVAAQRAVTEHGIFSGTTGGTLLDRSVFAAVTIPSGSAVQTTYDLTFNAGS